MIVCDVSGSMSEITGDNRSKLDALHSAIAEYPKKQTLGFSSKLYLGVPSEPQSCTDMALAFRKIRAWEFKKLLVISDGLPDSESAALDAAVRLQRPVNVLYIGEGGDEGEAFMRELARLTGGKQVTVPAEIKDFGRMLEHQTRRLLLK